MIRQIRADIKDANKRIQALKPYVDYPEALKEYVGLRRWKFELVSKLIYLNESDGRIELSLPR